MGKAEKNNIKEDKPKRAGYREKEVGKNRVGNCGPAKGYNRMSYSGMEN
jgi:hypothetical protein